jgi:hypothetical protein
MKVMKFINERIAELEQELSKLNDRLKAGKFVRQTSLHITLKEERIDELYGLLNKITYEKN